MGLVFFVLVAAAGMSAAGLGTDRVVLGLKWRHQFQFAGYYAAQAKGYYAEEGMEVRIEEGRPGQSSIETVLQGEAQFGVSDSDIVLARLQGRPLVVCAAVFQHSPSVILSRRDRNIRKPSDLAGARVMMPDRQGSAQLHAMLAREGIPAEAVHIVPHTWRLADLIEGRVDAVSAYATVEPAQLRGLGIESAGLHAIDYGVDFYGDMLFTTEREARAHPERAAAFTRASMKGWDYALRNPEEIADLILKFESVRLRGVTRKNLLDEAAAMKAFILPDLVEIGHLNPGRLQQIARTFTELKMAPRGRSLEGFLLAPRIHDPLPMRRLLQAGSVMALGVLLVFLWNLQIRRRVNRRTRELKEEVRLRTLAEAGLRASEERFRMMFTGAATGIAVMDPGGRFLQANPAYCATTGYSESELQGMTISDLLPGEDLAAYQGNVEALLAGKSEHFVREARCLKKGGGCAWKRASVSVVRTADGRPGSIILVAEDISARREAEEAASGNAELLHMAGRIGGIGAWSVEFPGARVIWSEEVYRIHELDTGAPPGMEAALDFFRPDSRRLLESAVQKGEPCDLELELVTARGNPRWVRATSKVERTTDGRLRRFYGIFQDITGRKHAAEKLKASEAQYRLLFTHNPLPMWVCEGDTLRFLAVNAAASLHYGYSEAEFLGMTLGDLRVGDATGDGQRHRTRNGTLIDVETSSDGIIFDGRPAFLTMAHDVTELARVYRAQRMLSACNEALIRAEAEDGLLHEICRIAVEIGGYRMAWVGFAREDEARTISPVAHAGAEDGYLSEIRLSWRDDVPAGCGPAGLTIRGGCTTLCEDIETDGRFALWREPARRRGYRGVVCLPLRDAVKTHGVLGLNSAETLAVGPDEIKLLQQLADDLAFGLDTIRARIERQKNQDAVLTMARGVSATIGAAFFGQLTQSMVAALGADTGVVAMLDTADPARVHTLSVVADGSRRDNFTYPLTGAPCEKVAPGEACVVPRDVQQHYPASRLMADLGAQAYVGHPLVTAEGRLVGIMAVVFRHPLAQTDFIASTLRIFATRAASELDRQQVDSRVREQAALLDKAQDAIIVRDLEHRITYWNKSAERLYGWTAQEALGRRAGDLLYEEAGTFNEAMRHVLEKGEWVGELHQVNKHREALVIEGHWTLVLDEQGVARSVLAINTDITAKKKLEHQFLRAQRMESIGTLAGGIAHDLNNVLAPVIMAVDLLKLSESEPRRMSLLDTIAASARRGADMVSQVLSFARGMEGRRVEVQIRHLIHDIKKITQDTFSKNIQIEIRISRDLWILMGDPTQLHQVLLNLCLNSRDAMPEGGRLTLSADNVRLDAHYASMNIEAKPGPHVRIQVEDTGTGIPHAIIDKIFDPFFTTKEVGKGTGLGLSTTLAIVKSHDGFIRVSSEENKGTCFQVFLPARASETAPAASSAKADRPRGSGETILVIDDEASIRLITRQTLEAFGYSVILAADGAEGVALYAEHRAQVAAVVIDMMMPVMDGPAAIHVLRKMNPDVRIVAASGITVDGAVAKAAAAGVKHFLPKPYTADALLLVLRQLTGRPAA